ncbi:MAG: threonine/serine exporter family protein, partial [Alistipes onderdonkii]
IYEMLTVGLANSSFCRLFGGDRIDMGIVFTSTLVGFAAKQRMQAHGVNHFLIFIISAFMASLCASAALRFDCSAETALATSVLFLVPGVPLINGVIDIVEGHILIGCSRLINALLLIICIAIGLSATLLMVKDGLL